MLKFDEKGLMTNIALTATSSDIIKTYVKLGLGVGLVAASSLDNDETEEGLKTIDASHLFGPGTTYICLHRGKHLRDYVYSLIELLEPTLTRTEVETAIKRANDNGKSKEN